MLAMFLRKDLERERKDIWEERVAALGASDVSKTIDLV